MIICKRCGAHTTLDPHIAASSCTFCGTAAVVDAPPNPNVVRPEGLLPFKVGRNTAIQKFRSWLASLWFHPNNLKSDSRLTSMQGVYIPYRSAASVGSAKERMRAEIRNECIRQIPGDTYRNLEVSTSFSALAYKNALLPVWIAAHEYAGKPYRYLVNGVTGKASGTAPFSVVQVTLARRAKATRQGGLGSIRCNERRP